MARSNRFCSGRHPCFFKVFLPKPNINPERLRIPFGFLKHIKGEGSGTVWLRGPSGNMWRVNLTKNPDGWFFEDGWEVFLKDHISKPGDFFVFRYIGNFHFSVQIFDPTACEKEASFRVKCSQENNAFVEPQGNKRGREIIAEALKPSPLKPFEIALKRKRVNPPQVHLERRTRNGAHKVNIVSNRGRGGQDAVSTKADKDSTLPCQIKERDKHLSLRSSRHVKIEMGPVTRGRKKISDLPIHETVSDTGGCCTRKAVESSSKFPYFVRCIKASNVGRSSHLSIPGDFAKTHLPRRRTNAILRNSQGSWIVGLDLGRERSTIRAGWINFVRDNMIRKGDTCIFELVGEREMRVHVFHERRIQSISSKSPVSSVCPCWSEACEADPSIDLVSHEKAKIENAHLPIDEMDSHTRGCLSKGQMRTEGRERVRRTAQSFTSDFPYFKWCMREYNVGGRRLILVHVRSLVLRSEYGEQKAGKVLRSEFSLKVELSAR
ncbi:PREDICTED: B3 domain-containing protein LOC_Os12g40080-like isoform X2 [Nelumbo nucifera]|uniref:B3 domain-containing protein LOC_Os12g40080-like isoform X2 n=1 Tax=Nelumbo nucifera TaxID=4432 RepID=A0A1U8A0I0_NELNU|nr:PREDICTED: B3 domain-containing protein LOC_Os12g40080-like isoform X2 [Nelumbo nucifera]XP_010255067.1 PREDICTED: B3 domain-containing protein LOC_Os12g40080-like isoform X2 [Nelumbo nucifera]